MPSPARSTTKKAASNPPQEGREALGGEKGRKLRQEGRAEAGREEGRGQEAGARRSRRRRPPKKAAAKKPAKKAPAKKAAAKKAAAKKAGRQEGAGQEGVAGEGRADEGRAGEGGRGQGRAGEGRRPRRSRPRPPKPKKLPPPLAPSTLQKLRERLEIERDRHLRQADELTAEADLLASEREQGDTQFDEESGEGDTVNVERERDLALSATDAPDRRRHRPRAAPDDRQHVRPVHHVRRSHPARAARGAPVGGAVREVQGPRRASPLSERRRDSRSSAVAARPDPGGWSPGSLTIVVARSAHEELGGRARSPTVRSRSSATRSSSSLTRNGGSAFSRFQGITPILAVGAVIVTIVLMRVLRRHDRPRARDRPRRSCSAARSATSMDRIFRAPGLHARPRRRLRRGRLVAGVQRRRLVHHDRRDPARSCARCARPPADPDSMTEPIEPMPVPATLDGERIDRAVALITGWSRADVQVLLARDAIVVDGRPVGKSHRLVDRHGDRDPRRARDRRAARRRPARDRRRSLRRRRRGRARQAGRTRRALRRRATPTARS